jgi:hypothetical protein
VTWDQVVTWLVLPAFVALILGVGIWLSRRITPEEPCREHNAALRDLEDLQTLDALRRLVVHAIEHAGQFDRIKAADNRL